MHTKTQTTMVTKYMQISPEMSLSQLSLNGENYQVRSDLTDMTKKANLWSIITRLEKCI